MVITTDKYAWTEGGIKTGITTGNNDGTIDLVHVAAGETGQCVERVLVSCPGITGTLAIVFYDDAAATTPITGTLYLAAQPVDGFILHKTVSSGTLGYRISGATGGSSTAYLTVNYFN